MSTPSSRRVRQGLINLISILCILVIVLSLTVIYLHWQPNLQLSRPTTGPLPGTTAGTVGSTPGQTTLPGQTTIPTLPGQTTLPTFPGQTTLPTQPGQTTVPTEPNVTTQPTEPNPTTRPTEPNPTTRPTEPVTKPTEPATEPTTQPTEPAEPFDEATFFAESAFLGDSVTLGLRNYCLSNKNALHGATILCAGSYAVRHAIDKVGGKDVVSITYQGEKMRPEDALAACGAKRVFIMLGLNDIAFGIDWTIGNWGKLIKNIRSTCPDIEIYIQSGTPIQLGGEKGSLNNTNMDKYNVKLEQFCKDNGCYFVNVAQALKNDQGGLREDYCSDDYCHLTNSGVKAWIQYLKDYAAAMHG